MAKIDQIRDATMKNCRNYNPENQTCRNYHEILASVRIEMSVDGETRFIECGNCKGYTPIRKASEAFA